MKSLVFTHQHIDKLEEAWRFFSFCFESMDFNSSLFTSDEFYDTFVDKFYKTALNMFPTTIPKCHLELLIRRFVKIILIWWTRKVTQDLKKTDHYKQLENSSGYGSKSMGGHFSTIYHGKK